MPDDWREAEREKYNRAYQSGRYCPTEGRLAWDRFAKSEEFRAKRRVLDVGCADGYGVGMCRFLGIEGWGIDIADSLEKAWEAHGVKDFCRVASADQIPFEDDYFDFVACLDMMEHLPEEAVRPTLKEIYRVGNDQYLIVVCIREATNKFYDGTEPHICIKDHDWWDERIIEAGFKIHKSAPSEDRSHIFVIAQK